MCLGLGYSILIAVFMLVCGLAFRDIEKRLKHLEAFKEFMLESETLKEDE